MIIRKCYYCEKETTNKKFCSLKCVGHVGGKIVQKILKERNLGFYNSETQRKLGKKAQQTLKIRKVSAFYDPKIQSMHGKMAQKTLREKKLGFYNSAIQRRLGKKGGLKGAETLRKHSKYTWNKVHFMSNAEMECAKKILTTPIVGINCHIQVGTKTIDFYPQISDKLFQGCFVEYHPIIKFLHPDDTLESYYTSRRKCLNENRYQDKKLIVITNLKNLA